MTFEDFYKSLRDGKSLTNDKGLTYVHLEDGVPVVRVSETNKIARTSPRIDFPPRGIVENETGYEVYEKPILDEAEKEYLGNIVKPYRDRVGFIVKTEATGYERIIICVLGLTQHNNYIMLPYFYKNTMYKGMEVEKEYTLEELGL